MWFVENLITLLLVFGAFFAGMKVSDKYHADIEDAQDYVIRVLGINHGAGYITPLSKEPKTGPIGENFMNKLKTEGKAIQQFSPSKPV